MNFNFGNGHDNGGYFGRPTGNIARQNSVYSLTFNEFQTTMGSMGADFGSMNMDELLKSIWTAEETQNTASAIVNGKESGGSGGGSGGYLQRQQGSLTLPRTLSQRTVDDVWKEIAKDGTHEYNGSNANSDMPKILGEITLEEFLFKAGVVREDTNNRPENNRQGFFEFQQQMNNNNQIQIQSSDLPLNVNGVRVNQQIHQQNLPKQPVAAMNGVRGGVRGIPDQAGVSANTTSSLLQGYSAIGSPVSQLSSEEKSNGDMSSVSPTMSYLFSVGARGRRCSGAVEKTIERRQKRMIKNRESAARSRARKQAYTMELEAEIAKLKEENEKLQKKQLLQKRIMEMQKNQVMEAKKMQERGGKKKRCLRRTQTGPW